MAGYTYQKSDQQLPEAAEFIIHNAHGVEIARTSSETNAALIIAAVNKFLSLVP